VTLYPFVTTSSGAPVLSTDLLAIVVAVVGFCISGMFLLLLLPDSSLALPQVVTGANSSLSSQTTLLQTQLGSYDDVNANAVATQISALQTQIQVSYSLTARLQQLTLAQYLPVA